MATKLKISLALASLLAILAIIYAFWLWQPERQVQRHQAHLLQAAESKHWTRFADFIEPGYHDRWGHDKSFAVRETQEILRQFFVLTIQSETVFLEVHDDHATVSARLKLDGQGTAVAEYARQAVNQLPDPFVFAWVRRSWQPWDWRLERVEQPTLRFDDGSD